MGEKANRIALRTSLLYGLAATLWILLSDRVLTTVFSDPSSIYRLQTYKGLAFVAVTASLLYATLLTQLRRWEREAERREQAEEEIRSLARFPSENPHPLLRIDRSGLLLHANDASYGLLGGWQLGIGKPVPAVLRKAVSETLESRKSKTIETECDGRVLSFFVAPMEQAGYANLYGRDVTESKQVEVEVTRLATAVEQSGDSIVITDREGTIQYVNPTFEKRSGYSKEEAIGKNPRILKSGKASAEFYEHLWGTITRGLNWTGRFVNRKKDGTLYEEEATISPVRDGTGKIVNYVAVKRDITERIRAEEEIRQLNAGLEQRVAERTTDLREAKERAESSDRAKSAFLSIMAHEFRTPLNAIIGFSELLVDEKAGSLNPQQREFLNDVLTSGRHLLNLINDVLDLTKIAAGKIEFKPEPFPLSRAILEACAIVKEMASNKRIAIKIDAPSDGVLVTLDPLRFKQILYNLLSNAVKFTPEGGKVEVAVVIDERNQIHLRVKDTGIGIKKEDLPRLFREFEQIDSGFARRQEGTGLGLALTKKIIELHKGSIAVESEVDKGSTFTVVLPTGSSAS
jgi:two-component system sensor histidine kinase/response regulator